MTPQGQYEHDQKLMRITKESPYPGILMADGQKPMTPEDDWRAIHSLRALDKPLLMP